MVEEITAHSQVELTLYGGPALESKDTVDNFAKSRVKIFRNYDPDN